MKQQGHQQDNLPDKEPKVKVRMLENKLYIISKKPKFVKFKDFRVS